MFGFDDIPRTARECSACSSETGQTSPAPAVATAVPHPDNVVCPCNTIGDPTPCPYLPQVITLPYVPTTAPSFTWPILVTRTAWACPRCGVVNAPHVDRCSCPAGWIGPAYAKLNP